MTASRLTVSAEERTRLAKARLGERVLGKWRLDRLIGVGGMAAVFEATHHNGNRIAIKILHPDLAGFDEIRDSGATICGSGGAGGETAPSEGGAAACEATTTCWDCWDAAAQCGPVDDGCGQRLHCGPCFWWF